MLPFSSLHHHLPFEVANIQWKVDYKHVVFPSWVPFLVTKVSMYHLAIPCILAILSLTSEFVRNYLVLLLDLYPRSSLIHLSINICISPNNFPIYWYLNGGVYAHRPCRHNGSTFPWITSLHIRNFDLLPYFFISIKYFWLLFIQIFGRSLPFQTYYPLPWQAYITNPYLLILQ